MESPPPGSRVPIEGSRVHKWGSRVRVEGSHAQKWRSRAPIEGSRVHKWGSRGLMGKPGASQARKGDPTSQQGEYSDVVYPCPRERGARASVFDGRANRGAHLGAW